MKIILKFDDEPELPIDVLPSVVNWVQRVKGYKTIAGRFEMASGIYWAYKYGTKTGTSVVDIRTERRYEEKE